MAATNAEDGAESKALFEQVQFYIVQTGDLRLEDAEAVSSPGLALVLGTHANH